MIGQSQDLFVAKLQALQAPQALRALQELQALQLRKLWKAVVLLGVSQLSKVWHSKPQGKLASWEAPDMAQRPGSPL